MMNPSTSGGNSTRKKRGKRGRGKPKQLFQDEEFEFGLGDHQDENDQMNGQCESGDVEKVSKEQHISLLREAVPDHNKQAYLQYETENVGDGHKSPLKETFPDINQPLSFEEESWEVVPGKKKGKRSLDKTKQEASSWPGPEPVINKIPENMEKELCQMNLNTAVEQVEISEDDKEQSLQQAVETERDRIQREREQIEREFSNMQLSKTFKPIIPGKIGQSIMLESNHIPLKIGCLQVAYHYDVTITPDMPKIILPIVFEKFRHQQFPERNPAFDGRKNMYTPREMPWSKISGEVTLAVEGTDKTYKIDIKYASFVNLNPLHDLTAERQSPTSALTVIDIVLRAAASKHCCVVGRSFFTKPQGRTIDLGNGMEMYEGFYQSAIRGGKLLLNVDVAHKAFPKAQSVVSAIENVCKIPGQDFSLNKPLSPIQFASFQKYIRNLKIVYEIPGQPNSKRFYRVNGCDDPPRYKTFETTTGSLTIETYFQRDKGYSLLYPFMPTLWVGSKARENRILLPVECCIIPKNQAVNRKMTDNQTTEMIRSATTRPLKRKEKIRAGVSTANYNIDPVVKEFGFFVGDKFEQVNGRVLQPPVLRYYNRKEAFVTNGCWSSENVQFESPAQIRKWTIVWTDQNEPPTQLERLALLLYQLAKKNGMNIGTITKPFQCAGSTLRDLTNYFQKNRNFDIIFVIVTKTYSVVKKAAEVNVGCLTQCIHSRTLPKLNNKMVSNILLKVNSKMSGINHSLANKPAIFNKPCMIMGADVTHPTPEAQNVPSVAAVVASHDPNGCKYNICWRLHKPKEEVIVDLKQIAKEQLLFFYRENNGQKPHSIIFFRDGVSEGQFNAVHNKEIIALQGACREMEHGYEPKITFIVVQKRHHTRLFPLSFALNDGNVPAGTCVDHTISNPCMKEFFLVSHSSIQGVAKPTKYCTLWDDNEFSNDELEQLAYFLCHMFSRCNRSVSYPAPTYYAHLAAARTKVYLDNNNDLNLNNLEMELSNHSIKDRIRKEFPMFFV